MQNKPSKWVSGYKHGPAASYTQITRMGLFLNVSTSKFEPLDSTWDNLHSGGMFISDDNKIYFRDETNKDIYINSPADNQLALYASSGVGVNVTPTEMLHVVDATAEGGVLIDNTATDGNPILAFGLSGTKTFTMGIDDGDSDQFKIFSGTAIDGTSEFVINGSGNMGIGVTPRDDWGANYTAMQIGPQGSLANYSDGRTIVGDNWYDDGAYKYIATDFASRYSQHNGEHLFDVAVSGSADGTITWLRAMDIEQGRDVKIEAGNLVIGTAGKGIDFQNQSSPGAGMTSELLDRYEEGTWTPAFPANTLTGSPEGRYTRIGNTVHAFYNLDALDWDGSGSTIITVAGLPFTSNDTISFYGPTNSYVLNVTATGSLYFYLPSSGTTLQLFEEVDNATGVAVLESAFSTSSGTYIKGCITYTV